MTILGIELLHVLATAAFVGWTVWIFRDVRAKGGKWFEAIWKSVGGAILLTVIVFFLPDLY